MALQPTRYDFRLTLSNVDRGRELAESVLLARHPSETQQHAILRMLALCLLNEEGLAFGPGLSTPDAADLWTHDLTGQVTTWVECGNATADGLRKVQQHHQRVGVHVVMDDARKLRELDEELATSRLPRGAPPITLWLVDAGLVRELAEKDERRQRWSVTVVGDHLYVDADGKTLDGAVARSESSSAAR
jgi:uncharacterized protein YaeQ